MRWSLVRLSPLFVLLTMACSGPAPAAEEDSVWDRYRSAMGPALAQVRGLRATGVVVDAAERTNRRLQIEAEAPARYRQRETSDRTGGPGIRQLIGFNGTIGWRAGNTQLGGDGLSPDAAVRERVITAASRQNYVNFIAGVVPVWLQEAGLTLTVVGTIPDGEDRGAVAINITHEGTELGRLVFDPKTHLPRRLVVPFMRSIRPEGGEYRLAFSDHRDAGQGVRLPHLISREQNGATVQWIISAYQLNPGLPAGTFEPPPPRARR